jgi:hypothetical protein
VHAVSRAPLNKALVVTMALKASISRGVAASDVPLRISAEFCGIVNVRMLTNGPYTVVAFPGMRGEGTSIVDSKTLAKVLRKCSPETEQVVAVAHDFTFEARDMLNQIDAVFFYKHDGAWSDDRWAYIRDRLAGSPK